TRSARIRHLSRQPITAMLLVDPITTPRRIDIVYDVNGGTPALAISEWQGPDRDRILHRSPRWHSRDRARELGGRGAVLSRVAAAQVTAGNVATGALPGCPRTRRIG